MSLPKCKLTFYEVFDEDGEGQDFTGMVMTVDYDKDRKYTFTNLEDWPENPDLYFPNQTEEFESMVFHDMAKNLGLQQLEPMTTRKQSVRVRLTKDELRVLKQFMEFIQGLSPAIDVPAGLRSASFPMMEKIKQLEKKLDG